ncbi:TIGR01777 family oxidoreductase [Bacillus shivajii]|uniref:TIGR01777 family oxidoreductase n=1 Tax=Bacillus shivajii TaxID=1983719 RepID=UPI001CFAF5CA|nr:TIGR01777 family oxidoreductase [Bacillus shivajii]UCZ54093.1 TIGR01777 family oxidoreductase [Bacillus shivajii]
MNVVIAGGSGLIGQALTDHLIKDNHNVFILTRNKTNKPSKDHVTYVEWLDESAAPERHLKDIDAVVNLAGENLNSGRWTKEKKQEILDSRIHATREIVNLIEKLELKPNVLINGSAIGYYGTSDKKTFTEDVETSGEDFLATVVRKWEEEASKANTVTRVVYTRFGMVLDSKDGALKKMLPPFKFGLGGKLGTGQQWMSWVHIDDVARAIIHCINTPTIKGPVNITAPNPERMKDFGKTLAQVLNRPFWAPVPSSILKIGLGEMSTLVLEGQKVLPKKLEDHHFTFTYRDLQNGLKNLLQ